MKASADKVFNIFSPRFWVGQLDLRPLGLMRIVFGCVVFLATIDLSPVLEDFFSDSGVAPRTALLASLTRANRFCIFDLAGPDWMLWTLYLATLFAIVCFILGWHSRVATVAVFLGVCGIHERDLLVFDGSDNVIRVLLFWLMFMPVGARYSVDAVLRTARGRPLQTHGTAFPIRMGQIQVTWIYLNTIIHKWPGASWHNGTALRFALGLEHLFTRTLGKLLFQSPFLIKVGTYSTVAIEIAFLPLVFLPLWRPRRLSPTSPWRFLFQPTYKALAILGGMGLHTGIALTMSVGNFSYVMISSYIILYEPEWAEGVVRAVGGVWGKGVTKVLYDGETAVYQRLARLLRGFDFYGNLKLINFRERGALAGISLPKGALDHQFHAIEPSGRVRSGYQAFLRIARRLPALSVLGLIGAAPGARLIGKPLYHRVTAKRPAVPVPPPTKSSEGWISIVPLPVRQTFTGLLYATMTVLIFACGWFALADTAKFPPEDWALKHGWKVYDVSPARMPGWLHDTLQEIELWQKWDMFSPNPLDTDIYLEGRGDLRDGTQVDVLRGDLDGGPLPPKLPGFFFSRWTKYINNLAYEKKDSAWLEQFARYLCRRWNAHPPPGRAALKTFKIYREQRRVVWFDEPPVPWGEEMIRDDKCF